MLVPSEVLFECRPFRDELIYQEDSQATVFNSCYRWRRKLPGLLPLNACQTSIKNMP